MSTILLGVFMFTFVILALVAVLTFAKNKLVASGNVNIVINGEKTLEAPAGSTLLNTLANHKIFIPSACGGKGSCGVCKVEVHEGGGAMLPTETSHISRGEAREGCRLSCQVKVKQDMKIEVEPEVFDVRRWMCKVRSNHNVATFIKELILELPEGESVPSAPADTFRSPRRRTTSSTRTSMSKRSTATPGTPSSYGSSNPRSTNRSSAPTRWRTIPRSGASSCSMCASPRRPADGRAARQDVVVDLRPQAWRRG